MMYQYSARRIQCFSTQVCLMVRTLSSGRRALNEDLKVYMHGRGNRERNDSVTNEILYERHLHIQRLNRLPAESDIVQTLTSSGLGDKKRKHQVYASVCSMMHGGGSYNNAGYKKTNSGAGGFAQHLSSASQNWPIFKHLLPEIAFAGHSNSGKSTLVNAMIGVLPSKGPAKVSERAGWTDQICFYQLGKKPPVLTLADLPGYGHAVASVAQRRAWGNMMRDYLQNRPVLSRCCILVDATRGLCKGDKMLVRFLTRYEIPWLVVLTKGDLLDCPTLARCVLAVQLDLAQYVTPAMVRAAAAANSSGSSASDISSTSRAQAVQDGSAGGSAAADTGSTDADTDTDVVESDSELQSVSHSDSGTDGGDCSSTGTVCAEEDEWSEGESGGDLATGDRDRHHLQIDHRELSRYSQLAAAEERPEGESELQDEDVEVIGSAKNDDDDGVAQEEWEEEEEEDEEEGEEEVQPKAEDLNVPNRRLVPVAVVSSSTGAGVQQLWKRLCAIARDDSVLPPGVAPSTTHVVREHRMAQTLRRRHAVQHSVDRRGRVGGSQKHVPRANSREPKPPSLRPVKLARNRRTVRARIREAAQEKLQEARKKFEEVVVN